MKARFALALVLCVAAAAFFSPVKAEEEDATVQLNGEDEHLSGDVVEPLSRELKEVEGSSDADEDTVEGTGTDLDQDPSDGMLRDLKWYDGYYGKPYRRYYGHGRKYGSYGRRLAGYDYYKSPRSYYTPYYYGHGHKHWKGRRLAGYGYYTSPRSYYKPYYYGHGYKPHYPYGL